MFFEEMMNSYWAKKSGKKKGFTLVEMLVVVAIIAALASIMIPTIKGSVTKSAAATNAANLRAAKGAFTTLKLMYPDDYSTWSGGVTAMLGVEAVNEQFVVSGDPSANKAASNAVLSLNDVAVLSSGSPLTVPAPNAVKMVTDDVTIAEGTPMNAQIIKNEHGVEEVYVTYDGYPIAYFAAVAENGSANPSDYLGQKGSGNILAGKEWVNKLTSWGNEIATNAADQTALGMPLYGNLISQMTDIMQKPSEQGDCLECAMNNVNTSDAGLLGAVAGDKVDKLLANKGWEQSGYNPNDPATEALKAHCVSYTPKDGKYGSPCVCSTEKNQHGPEAHISTSNSLGIGEGMEACSAGGVHSLDYNHHCSKCNKDVHVTNGQPDHEFKSSMPYMDALLEGSCIYCNFCQCCYNSQQGGYRTYDKYIKTNTGLYPYEKRTFPAGYQLAYVSKKLPVIGTVSGYVDGGVCMSTDPVLGDLGKDGKTKGCGHALSSHTPKS